MTRKTWKILFIIALIFCVLSIGLTVLTAFIFIIPNENNTQELTLTFDSVEKPMNLMYYVKVVEYNSRLIIHAETIADLEALQELNSGDSITVRVLTAKSETIKHSSVEIVEMKKDDKAVISLEKSQEFARANRKMILPIGVVFSVLFAILFIIGLCGYKQVFKRK